MVDYSSPPVMTNHYSNPIERRRAQLSFMSDLGASAVDGWLACSEQFTYYSPNIVSLQFDPAARFVPGAKVRFKQNAGTYVYFVIARVDIGNNRIDFIPNTSYVVASEQIYDISFSLYDQPLGWPGYFGYTPTWTSASNPQPSLGDGSLSGRYFTQGKHIIVMAHFYWGSTTTGGTGDWRFSLPYSSSSMYTYLMTATVEDSGAGTLLGTTKLVNLGNFCVLVTPYGSGSNHWQVVANATSPFTWAQGDTLDAHLCYEWVL